MRILETDSLPLEFLVRSIMSAARRSASSLMGNRSAVFAYFAAATPARRPKTIRSPRLFVPNRFAPCNETQATSPAAYRPRTSSLLVVPQSTSPSIVVGMPPIV